MKAGIFPINGFVNVTVFHWIIMNVIHVLLIISIIFDAMLPITALPDSTFAFSLPARIDGFTFVDIPGKTGFDQHPTSRIIMIGLG